MEEAAGAIVMEVKLVAAAVTLSMAAPLTEPEVAVIIAEPKLEPVARPEPLMLAMLESEELHRAALVTSCVVPSDKWAVAVNCCDAPTPIAIVEGETWMDDTVAVDDNVAVFEDPFEPQPASTAINATKTPMRNALFIPSSTKNLKV